MDIIDALGERPDRHEAFARELLAEADDHELQQVVAKAAADLDAPIALVSLVLDDIQFFKAHHGLPEDLAAARGMHRGASFCQFVVRDGAAFNVEDAASDERLPQMIVKEYDIRSYLGVPISVADITLGSLCVIDTKPRSFSSEDQEKLEELAVRVDERLRDLASSRKSLREELSVRARQDAFAEIQRSLEPMRHAVAEGLPTISAIRSFFRLAEHVAGGGHATPNAMKHALIAAERALSHNENVLYDIQAAVSDCDDCFSAVDTLSNTAGSSPRLSEVLEAAQDIARSTTREVGGTVLPDLARDPLLSAPKAFAVSVVGISLTQFAQHLDGAGLSDGGIQVGVNYPQSNRVAITLTSPSASEDVTTAIAEQLERMVGADPSISVDQRSGSVRIVLQTLVTDQ